MRPLALPRVLWHLLAYALALAAVSAVVPLDASFGSDDGAYGGQVWALRQGSWVLDRPLPVVDAGQEGWLNGAIVAGGPVPYSTSPAWVKLLAASAALVHGPGPGVAEVAAGPTDNPNCGAGAPNPAPGATDAGCGGGWAPPERAGDLGLGLHLPGLLAALAAAAAAWRLAARWDRRAAPVAFWLVALSPLLVDTTTLWAHTLGSACAGWATVAVSELWPRSAPTRTGHGGEPATVGTAPHRDPVTGGDVARGPRRHRLAWTAGLVAALALGAAVRTEAVFWTLSLVVAAVLADRSRAMVASVLTGASAAAAAWIVSRAWGASIRSPRLSIETSVEALREGRGWMASRIPAAWQLIGTGRGAGWGQFLSFGGMLVALGAAVALYRAGKERRPLPVPALAALVVATACYLVNAVVAPDVAIPGILAAWPVVAVALAAGRWPAVGAGSGPDARWLLVPVGLMTVAVLATQYESSGGLQWGGRYLSMTYVPLAAAAAVGVTPALFGNPVSPTITGDGPAQRIRHDDRRRWALAVGLAALAAAPTLSGLATSHRFHTTHAMIVDLTTNPAAEVVITDQGALPRVGWTALPTTFYRADVDSIDSLLAQLAEAGVASVNVAGLTAADIDGVAGWRLASINADPHGTIRHLIRP
ncbi:MAG: hypothetical protein OEY41_15265 [Acidimicrobiia bacterium]|nr:hypothetical protein [Acidimicrobiia bacterium]